MTASAPKAARTQSDGHSRSRQALEANKTVRLTTPRLTLRFPRLHQPHYGTAEYPKPDGEYSTSAVGRLTDPALEAFVAALAPLIHAARIDAEEQFRRLKPETRRKLGAVRMSEPFMTVYDQATELPTGDVQFKFAMKASGFSQHEERLAATMGRSSPPWRRRPDIFDARGVFIDEVPEILGGTVARVSCDVTPYFVPGTAATGLKLALAGVQIIHLVTREKPNFVRHGFAVEDDGYVYDEGAR